MRPRVWIWSLTLLLVATTPDQATAGIDQLELWVDHINVYDYGSSNDSGVLASWMVLRYLNGGVDGSLGVNPFITLTDYARSLQPAGPYTEAALANTLNHFRSQPVYHFEVIHSDSLAQLAGEIGYWMNRNESRAPAYPSNVPALVPFAGQYDHWAVVTGVVAEEDPYAHPATPIHALWIDDPLFYCDPNDPVITALYYSLVPGEEPPLEDYLLPMTTGPYTGQYVALVHIPESATVPEPASAALCAMGLVGFVAYASSRRIRPRRRPGPGGGALTQA